jgi:hypothetical protein
VHDHDIGEIGEAIVARLVRRVRALEAKVLHCKGRKTRPISSISGGEHAHQIDFGQVLKNPTAGVRGQAGAQA